MIKKHSSKAGLKCHQLVTEGEGRRVNSIFLVWKLEILPGEIYFEANSALPEIQ